MKKFFCVIILLSFFSTAYNQVKIGTNPSVIDPFSVLELEGTQKGLLLPRVASATDLALMSAAPEGMIVYFVPDASLYIKQSSSWLKLVSSDWGRNSASIYNTNTGFVGIGTSSPTRKLTVKTPAGGIGISQESPNGLTSMGFFVSNGGEAYLQTHSNDDLNFTTNNGQSQLVLKTNGNFGIGTITPNASLSVGRGTGVDGTAAFFGTNNISHFNYSTNEDTYIRAGKNGSSVIINDIANGRTGVGTNTPLTTLHLKMLYSVSPDGLMLERDVNNKWITGVDFADDYSFYMFNGSSYPYRGYIDHVSGTYFSLSDKNLKKDIESVDNGLSMLLKLNPVRYHFLSGNKQQYDYGFLSQEVEKIFPDFVTEKDGVKMLAYNNFIPVTVKSIQEQQQQIETLQKENTDLKARLERLEKIILK